MQAVCKLPFIEEFRLLSEIGKVENTLTDEEKKRNSLGLDMLFIHGSHPLGGKIFSFCERNKDNPKLTQTKVKRKINPKFSHGMNGYMYISDKPVCPIEIPSPIDGMDMIRDNKVMYGVLPVEVLLLLQALVEVELKDCILFPFADVYFIKSLLFILILPDCLKE
nr:5'-3' exoribonuclease 4-like [Ipomoea batatas]